jgi:hypothetical protein
MDKLKLIEAILNSDCKTSSTGVNAETFLEIGKVYAVRTITMIYTGRLKAVNAQEYLFDEVAWIPETERFKDFAETGAHKEAEPYPGKVVIGRGGLLDAFEIPSVIRKQK